LIHFYKREREAEMSVRQEKRSLERLLVDTVARWCNSQPDIVLVSLEGHKVYTHRSLVCLYSTMLDSMLSAYPTTGSDLPWLSVPASSASLINLLKLLSCGVSVANSKSHLLEATKAAEVLGICLENCQIGIKKRKGETRRIGEKCKADPEPEIESAVKKAKKENVIVNVNQQQETNNDELREVVDESSKEAEEKKRGRKKSGEKEGEPTCEECSKKFSSKQSLKRHLVIHTDSVFSCHICWKGGLRADQLEKHKLSCAFKAVQKDQESSKLERQVVGTEEDNSV